MNRALLGSCVLFAMSSLAAACGSSSAPAGDAGGRDTSLLDSSTGDTAVADSSASDSSVADSSVADSSAGDSSVADTGTDSGSPGDGGLTDAALPWPTGCGSPAPAWADLTVVEPGECPAFTACGGDIVGAWDLSGGCFEIAVNDAISSCPGAMVTRRAGRGRGCVDFGADGIAHRVAESEVNIDVFVPAICASFVSCSMIESQLRTRGLDASCPADASGNCDCTTSLVTRIDDTDGYTTSGNEIIGTASGKHWGYCVAGTQMNYQDTSTSGTLEPGTIELTKR